MPRVAVVGALGVVLCAGLAFVLLREREPEPAAVAAEPVAALRAEGRLVRRLRAGGLGDAASVDCAGPVRAGRTTRCEVGYANGDVQLILVSLAAEGAIDIAIPYPAQRRPG
ncbi:MAG TPA: hypothetical protein VEY90_08960 [Thermoleophilaceae bacterium]|nr:hypothetical protein [Thermoleophilaceae bacterium]